MLTRRIQALAALALVDLMLDRMDRKLREAQESHLDLSDIHAHCCNACGYVWKHPLPVRVSSDAYARAHYCPQCETGPYRVRLLEHEFTPQRWAELPYVEPKL